MRNALPLGGMGATVVVAVAAIVCAGLLDVRVWPAWEQEPAAGAGFGHQFIRVRCCRGIGGKSTECDQDRTGGKLPVSRSRRRRSGALILTRTCRFKSFRLIRGTSSRPSWNLAPKFRGAAPLHDQESRPHPGRVNPDRRGGNFRSDQQGTGARPGNHGPGVSEREKEQATSDQQTAEGALKAARDAVRVFGKTDAEIDQIIASRKIDPALVVRSPISGQITSQERAAGAIGAAGKLPAPYSVADVSIKWMLANVMESDIPLFHLGQPVQVRVMSYPDRVFSGRVSKIYETVDPNTHRVTIRSEIADPNNELHPGMLANFVIRVHDPVESIAIPTNGVVREADGTMTAWVTTDRRRFVQRILKIGLRKDDQVQILEGLQRGELAVTDGAVFLSNMLDAPPSD